MSVDVEVTVICDGDDCTDAFCAELAGDDASGREDARRDGWVCNDAGDWCPACAAEKGLSNPPPPAPAEEIPF